MIFSNPQFSELTPDELNTQHSQLEDVRQEHYRQLFTLGVAHRVINSPSLTNMFHNKSTLTEGTLLYPFRSPLWNLSLRTGESIYADANIHRSRSLLQDPLLSLFGDSNSQNYVYYLGRFEPTTYGCQTWSYAAGIVLDKTTATAIEREPYIPFKGVKAEDLQLIEKQLSTLAAVAVEKSLDIIDPLTLSEVHGQIIGYEDSDYPAIDGGNSFH